MYVILFLLYNNLLKRIRTIGFYIKKNIIIINKIKFAIYDIRKYF